jgi:hypothetical protein
MRLKSLCALLTLGILAILPCCSSDTFPKYVVLGGLRVLAIRADLGSQFSGTSEFSPGDSVVITPYVSSYGLSGALSYEANGCLDPGVNYGAEPSCTKVPGTLLLGAGVVTLTGGVSNTGQANSFSATIPTTILTARSAVDQYNGVNYLIVYKLSAADGSSISTFKRMPVSAAAKTKNQNPTITSLTANGAALSAMPTGDANVAISYPAAARENFSSMRSDGVLTSAIEDLTTTYFITDGSLKYFRTVNDQATVFTPPSPAPTDHTPIIVGVARDSRGGVAVKVQGL